jgi:hypothetical protein
LWRRLRKNDRGTQQKAEEADAHCAQGDFGKARAMRDWILAVAPLTATLYFLVHQDQFREVLRWIAVFVP